MLEAGRLTWPEVLPPAAEKKQEKLWTPSDVTCMQYLSTN